MDDQTRAPWRILRSQYAVETPYLRLRADQIELPDGTIVDDYYVRETRGFVVIFALRPDRRVLLVRQYKHGIGQSVLELPAGAIDEGESPRDCAVRELAEETGYVGDEPELVRAFIADPTNSNGYFYLFLVRNAVERVAQAFDVTEDITVELAPLGDLRAMMHDEQIVVGSHVASIYAVLDRLAAL